MGIQGFYDTLMDHAQNMAMYPNMYQWSSGFGQSHDHVVSSQLHV
jgi:hypothetical protein